MAALAFASCSEPNDNGMAMEKQDTLPPPHTVIVIEGCEYFRFYSTHGYVLITHKGNCKNPIHCRNDRTL